MNTNPYRICARPQETENEFTALGGPITNSQCHSGRMSHQQWEGTLPQKWSNQVHKQLTPMPMLLCAWVPRPAGPAWPTTNSNPMNAHSFGGRARCGPRCMVRRVNGTGRYPSSLTPSLAAPESLASASTTPPLKRSSGQHATKVISQYACHSRRSYGRHVAL